MNQSLTLPMADKFYHDKQTSAFIRSVNVSWEKPEKDHYYLEYSYNQKDWYALNGGFPIVLPCDELSVTDALETQDPNGETISVAALSSLQNKYGKPEPVCIQSVERCESDPETVQVTYTNGMKEIRNIIRSEDGIGHIQDNDYAAPIISHRADPYIYKHTDGKYYFLGSHTDAGHNLNGTYQYLYIILRCADTLEDLTDNSGRYTEKVIYEREPIGPDRVSPHLWAPESPRDQSRQLWKMILLLPTSLWTILSSIIKGRIILYGHRKRIIFLIFLLQNYPIRGRSVLHLFF